jgi:nucleoside-diphosphate-sugar epimerase
MRQKILVTGASGLIGRHAVDLFLRRGHQVRAFQRHPLLRFNRCVGTFAPIERPCPPQPRGATRLCIWRAAVTLANHAEIQLSMRS